jgi:hypothetical protein
MGVALDADPKTEPIGPYWRAWGPVIVEERFATRSWGLITGTQPAYCQLALDRSPCGRAGNRGRVDIAAAGGTSDARSGATSLRASRRSVGAAAERLPTRD